MHLRNASRRHRCGESTPSAAVNEAETTLQADIHMERGPRVFIFHVAVEDPAAPSYLSHDSYKEENVAAK